MLKLFLWLRYVRKRKIVFLSIAAVALSVSLLIVVASLFTAFINAYEQSAVDMLGDVILVSPIKFSKYPLFIKRLEQASAVDTATAILSSQGLLHLGSGNVRAVFAWPEGIARRTIF
jgi:ABC-type lipoprotein release transport system permease subunit